MAVTIIQQTRGHVTKERGQFQIALGRIMQYGCSLVVSSVDVHTTVDEIFDQLQDDKKYRNKFDYENYNIYLSQKRLNFSWKSNHIRAE